MNTRRTPTRRVEENDVNEEIPPQVEQNPQGDQVPIVVELMMFWWFPRKQLMGRLERLYLLYPEL